MAKRGAKNKYETLVKPYLEEVNKKVRQGVTEEAIAQALGISVASLNNYRNKYPEFAEALKKDKGVDVLQELINAGVKAAKGYFETTEETIIILDDDNIPVKKQKVIKKTWYPPNATLNQFYVKNFGKGEGWTGDPLDYELRKAKHDLDQAAEEFNNWQQYLDTDKK